MAYWWLSAGNSVQFGNFAFLDPAVVDSKPISPFKQRIRVKKTEALFFLNPLPNTLQVSALHFAQHVHQGQEEQKHRRSICSTRNSAQTSLRMVFPLSASANWKPQNKTKKKTRQEKFWSVKVKGAAYSALHTWCPVLPLSFYSIFLTLKVNYNCMSEIHRFEFD